MMIHKAQKYWLIEILVTVDALQLIQFSGRSKDNHLAVSDLQWWVSFYSEFKIAWLILDVHSLDMLYPITGFCCIYSAVPA